GRPRVGRSRGRRRERREHSAQEIPRRARGDAGHRTLSRLDSRPMRRRDFLDAGVAAVAASVLPRATAAEDPKDELLAHVDRPQDLATPTEYFDRLITPTSVFFVRSHFGPPLLEPSRRLRISGMVSRPLDLAVNELKKFKEVTLTAVLQC